MQSSSYEEPIEEIKTNINPKGANAKGKSEAKPVQPIRQPTQSDDKPVKSMVS
jgi:hypothetical protein